MSLLSDKILSYGPEHYWTLNYPLTTTPTNLGSVSYTAAITNTNAAATPPSASTESLPGSGGSWYYPYFSANSGARSTILTGSGSATTVLNDHNYTIGFSFKVPVVGTGTQTNFYVFQANPIASSTNNGFYIAVAATGATGNVRKLNFRLATGVPQYGTTPILVQDNTWYQVIVIKNGTTYNVYVNGVLWLTHTTTYPPVNSTNMIFGSLQTNGYVGFTGTYFSDIFIGTASMLDATAISEIWSTANTSSNNLKYWNGTDWTVPVNKYEWDGINWVTMTGSYWNGSSWVAIT